MMLPTLLLGSAVLLWLLAVRLHKVVNTNHRYKKFRKYHIEVAGKETHKTDNTAKNTSPVRQQDNEEPQSELEHYKELYHKLQNLEEHPEIIEPAYRELIQLLAQTLQAAKLSPNSGILSIGDYSSRKLSAFLAKAHQECTEAWEQYLDRRRNGGLREMFSDVEDATWWLKNSAPVKYVDGAWLGHIAKITTPFSLRRITKNAWQIMSEELGDGDLKKNHVYVYERLMEEIGANLPAGWTRTFISPEHQLNEVSCWKASVAQLLISLFPHDFLPEILGFNMAYEGLPLHLMKTTKELRELRLNNYYFVLHISIDNADSGHAAMAMDAVTSYIDMVVSENGQAAGEIAWRRVQAGFILAEGLPTTPETQIMKVKPRYPRNELEGEVLKIFSAKASVAHKIHCSSRLKIGERTLVDWLEPAAFMDPQRQSDFLESLAGCKPWVNKGNSTSSKLVQELSWDGRMYGAFTNAEVLTLCAWIDSLGMPTAKVYYDFASCEALNLQSFTDILSSSPFLELDRPGQAHCNTQLVKCPEVLTLEHDLENIIGSPNLAAIIPSWLASLALLENFANVPSKLANKIGSAIIRVQRAQMGFNEEVDGVAGMDEFSRSNSIDLVEVGLALQSPVAMAEQKTLRDVLSQDVFGHGQKCAAHLLHLSKSPYTERGRILGISYAFAQLHQWTGANKELFIDSCHRAALTKIALREIAGLKVCLELESSLGDWQAVVSGFLWAKSCILQQLSTH